MDELGGMEVLKCPKNLIEHVSLVHVFQDGLTHKGVQVCFHVIEK